jgi:hypothetical protein
VPESANSSLTPFTYALASFFVCFTLVPLASGRAPFLTAFLLCSCFLLFVSCLSYRRRLAGAFAVAFVVPPFRAAGFTFFLFAFASFEI